MRKKLALAAALVSASILVPSSAALAQSTTSANVSVATSTTTAKKYEGDSSVAALLLTGTGPLARTNPGVVKDLGFSSTRDVPSAKAVDDFTTAFLKATPNFHSSVAIPIQSGDPYKVKSALVAISKQAQAYAATLQAPGSSSSVNSAAEVDAASGFFKVYTKGVVVTKVLVNVSLYANVAVATEAVVAAAAVAVVAVVVDYRFAASATTLDQQSYLAAIARDLTAAS